MKKTPNPTSQIPKFKINNSDQEKVSAVKGLLEKMRPALQMHGGDLEFVELTKDGVVKINLQGHCVGCALSTVTLKLGIEKMLCDKLPEIVTAVEEI